MAIILHNLHLVAPETLENSGANVYCPVTSEFTAIVTGKSADGMEAEHCRACDEVEPQTVEVSDDYLDEIFHGRA